MWVIYIITSNSHDSDITLPGGGGGGGIQTSLSFPNTCWRSVIDIRQRGASFSEAYHWRSAFRPHSNALWILNRKRKIKRLKDSCWYFRISIDEWDQNISHVWKPENKGIHKRQQHKTLTKAINLPTFNRKWEEVEEEKQK